VTSHMKSVESIDRANQGNLLWPPIADAVDTFLKRRASKADAYERIWRLIHVWEAISITLVGAGVARIRCMPEHAVLFLRCREHLHGRTWNSVTRSFEYYQGALDGSALARLNILHELSTTDTTSSSFLTALKAFLNTECISVSNLVQAWARICDVPDQAAQAAAIAPRAAMRLLNEFRNRIAHVPFPYDGLDELANAVEELSEQLFNIEPPPWQGFRDERLESPMCGSLLWRDRVLYGSAHRANQEAADGLQFSYPTSRKTTDKKENWAAEPFALVDSMLRPFVLTRLRAQATGVWEFTRFRAEANAVIYHEAPTWQANVPPPAESEYTTPEAEKEQAEEREIVASASSSVNEDHVPEKQAAANEFEQALRFIRNEDYAPAIEYFARLVATRPDYHIGWLRLGHAQRELAMRLRITDAVHARELFDKSIDSLGHAGEHAHPDRRAHALYERSKAYFQRGRFTESSEDYESALLNAHEAHKIQADAIYDSWIAYLKSHPPRSAA
jgi:tetratricopeptide (TPR) repeat protein